VTTFERRQRTLDLLRQEPGIRVPELARTLGVSEGTVRNDLTFLEQTGTLTRVRGGAVVRKEAAPAPERTAANGEAVANQILKQVIAHWAADMVDDGDSILLDASTTARSLTPYLLKLRNLTIVTHSIETALELAENPTHTVILLGGVLRASGKRVLGHLGEANLEQLHVKTAFLSCAGLSVEAGLTESDYAEAQLKRKMIASAEQVVALVDSSKFGHVDLTPFARVDQIDRIFTDSQLDPSYLAELRETCAVVTVCDRESVTSFSPCGGDSRHYRIGFANLTETDIPFAIDVRRGLERAAKEAGNIDMVLADNQLNGEMALRVADELISRRVDLAIEFQIDERMGSLITEKFDRASIPVIAIDIPMVGATYFGVNNYQVGFLAGQALGEWVREHWQGRVDCLFILEEMRAGALPAARIQGQLDGLCGVIGEVPASQTVRIDSGNTSAVSEAHTGEALRRTPDTARIAVISFNDDAAIGAIAAARRLGREHNIVVVGQGADRVAREELRRPDSRLIGTTAYMPEKYGEQLLQIAQRILAREPVPPAVYCQHVFITKENLDRYYPETEAQRG
jgi:ribose transport system substrate-binding protein